MPLTPFLPAYRQILNLGRIYNVSDGNYAPRGQIVTWLAEKLGVDNPGLEEDDEESTPNRKISTNYSGTNLVGSSLSTFMMLLTIYNLHTGILSNGWSWQLLKQAQKMQLGR